MFDGSSALKLEDDAESLFVSARNGMRNSIGNRTVKTMSDWGTETYTYDNLNRLIEAWYPDSGQENFTYDGAGNRLTHSFNGQTENFQYDVANQMTLSYTSGLSDTTLYVFDGRGVNTAKGNGTDTTNYTFDMHLRMTDISGSGVATIKTAYNGERNGLRIAQSTDGDSVWYLLDGFEVLADLDSTYNVTRRYVHGPIIDEHWGVAEYDTAGTITNKRYFLTDALGSVVDLTNETGTITDSYHYRAFGEAVERDDSTSATRYRYTGRESLGDNIGLYYYRARYYSPSQGRFTRLDPLGFVANENGNMYFYVEGNPVIHIDPTGKSVFAWDDQAEVIYNHWYKGNGQELVIDNDNNWTLYMMNAASFKSQVKGYLDVILQETKMSKEAIGASKTVIKTEHPVLQANNYFYGYGLMHGTNSTVGGLGIVGELTKAKSKIDPANCNSFIVEMNMRYTWNDIMDPKPDVHSLDHVADLIFGQSSSNQSGGVDYTFRLKMDISTTVDIQNNNSILSDDWPFQ